MHKWIFVVIGGIVVAIIFIRRRNENYFNRTVYCFFIANFADAQVKKLHGKSRISHVILYRLQAMVSREIEVGKERGELAVLIDGLPLSIVPDSLFATSDDMDIRSVRYFTEYITDEKGKR